MKYEVGQKVKIIENPDVPELADYFLLDNGLGIIDSILEDSEYDYIVRFEVMYQCRFKESELEPYKED